MRPFRYLRPTSVEEAVELLATDPEARPLGGGSDLLGEMKEGITLPGALVALSEVPQLREVAPLPDGGLALGATTTLAQMEGDPLLQENYTALAQAAASVATPQIRNVATLGGNLCQRPRCWFYRSPLYDCRKKGGAICFAVNGDSKYHAILGGRDCFIVHPSDLAVALLALDGRVEAAGPGGRRTLPAEDFFAGPDRDITRENVLEPGELVTGVLLPPPTPGGRSLYLKVRERSSVDFALVSVAVWARLEDGRVSEARVALGGVAPVPWRSREAEEALAGIPVEQVDAEATGWAAVEGARPLRDNHYKIPLAASLVARAVASLLPQGP